MCSLRQMCGMRHLAVGLVIAVGLALFPATQETRGAAERKGHGARKGYCEPSIVRNYERPLRRLPAVRRPPNTKRLPFGPRRLEFYQAFALSGERLIVGKGSFGYGFLDTGFGAQRRLRVGWIVRASLFSVSKEGVTERRLGRVRKRFGVVGSINQPHIALSVPASPGFYQFDISFQKRRGKRLGKFSEYIRVMDGFVNVRVGTKRKSYRPGETVYARVENLGTEEIRFGAPYAVEHLTEVGWVRVGPKTRGWPRWLAGLYAGGAGKCMDFRIPETFAPGLYRIVKSVKYGPWKRGETDLTRFGKFEVRRR